MLEIRHVTKKYITKGVCVTALNDVSVTFPEKGMVFLVGKSGSGKSTLLNISGGLDSPDEGEIILKGKSLKSFTEADFDSYRNTYIGFIFQEFNVLNEYTVEENVSLALELQGKPSDKAKVEELLKKVDLEGYGKRKPNTLSGGQKQRVAIARALVKNPEIIMADEPTGALDSATGKQVFDTLKKLSKEKLVIVVSHDLDFANRYADRIIELKDGVIFSDRIKGETTKRRAAVNKGDTLYVVPDEPLSPEDIEEVKSFYSSSAAEKKISVKAFSEADNFSPSLAAESKKYNGEDVTFIKSRLPVKHAIRMGASSLKIKPVRLVFTILLSTIAFIIFGLFTTLVTFSKANVIAHEAVDNSFQGAVVSRSATVEQHYFDSYYGDDEDEVVTYSYDLLFSDEDVSSMQSKYGMNAVGIYTYGNDGDGYYTVKNNVNINNNYVGTLSLYYSENMSVRGFCDLENKDLSSYGLKLVAGRYPTGENEVAITTYQYDLLKKGGFFPVKEQRGTSHYFQALSSYDSAIGCWISLANTERVIVMGTSGESMADSFTGQIVGVIDCGEIPEKYSVLRGATTDIRSRLDAEKVNGLSASEILNLASDFYDYYINSFNGVYFVGDAFYKANISEANYGSFLNYKTMAGLAGLYAAYESGKVDSQGNVYETDEEAIARCVRTRSEYSSLIGDKNSAAGHYFVTDFDYNSYDSSSGKYDYLYFSISSKAASAVESIVSLTENPVNDISYSIGYSFMYEANLTEQTVNEIMTIFLAAGVGLALFAALMLSNFISASINGKEKDIGVLRAIGAKGTDIFKIFITEALIITLSCFFISIAATSVVCNIINGYLIAAELVSLSMFLFITPDAFMMLAVAVLSAFIATILPVYRTVKKKPVEAIRCL